MSEDIYDLTVRVQNEMIRLRKASTYHPSDVNALLKGVFTGLNLGINYLEAKIFGNGELVLTFLAGGRNNSLATNLAMANGLMPENRPFTSTMFVGLSYRTSKSHHFYEKGMEWGFSYVLDLYQAFLGLSSEVVARRMTMDHVKAVVKMLEQI